MEKVLGRFRSDIAKVAEAYAKSQDGNTTLLMMTEVKRGLFVSIPEHIRIRDLEESPDLEDEMTDLFAGYPIEPGWPYFNQLDFQDRCYGEKGCMFKPGSALYRSKNCEHYVCQAHKDDGCCKQDKDKEGSLVSQQSPSEKTMEQREAPINVTEKEKAGEKPESVEKSTPKHSGSPPVVDEGTDKTGGKASKSIEKKKEDEKPESIEKSTPKHSGSPPVVDEGTDKAGGKASNSLEKKRKTKFEVEDGQSFSVDDFEFKKEDRMLDVQVCQIKDKDGNLRWMLEEEYVALKTKYVNLLAKEDSEEEL
jgi:hypothetical protein